jgi:flavodoxin
MKKAVIFYSFEGNTKLIAETIATEIEADLIELRPKDEKKSKGFMKYFWGGRAVMRNIKPELYKIENNIQEYDVLFIGSPVWAFNYAPALKTFFSENTISNKKIGLFCCHGGGKGKVFTNMRAALEQNQILGEIDFFEPLKKDTEAKVQKAKEWAVNIIKGIADEESRA